MHFGSKIFKHKYFSFFFLLLIVGGFFLASNHVLAQANNGAFGLQKVGSLLPLGSDDIRVIAAKIIRIGLGLLGIVAVGFILFAGFTWMTSGGNEEKIATAKKTLINATIGLAIILSSFAITQFIINSLAAATGAGGAADNAGQGPVPICANFADCQANGGGPHECGDEGFVVKSLTPRTPTNNGTGMTNTVIRAVFSRPLDDGQNLDKIFKLTKGNNPVQLKTVKILPGRYIVEAFFGDNTQLCSADGDTRSCLSPGDYKIEVNPDLVAGGVKLQTKLTCGTFDTTANFNINQDFIDAEHPLTDSITFNGKNTREGQTIGRGAKYHLNATFEDRKKTPQNIAFGGISYLHLRVQSEPKDVAAEKVDWSYFTGPKSGSNEAFSLSQDLVFGADAPVPALYSLSFDAADIDHNFTLATSTFILDGELCHNGIQDVGETGIDIGGKCLGDGACSANWQCLSGECGANGQCINSPIIRDVDVGGNSPGSWDGAPGSWATITGNFFGEDAGTIYFGSDNDHNGVIEDARGEWIQAPLASCNGLDVWHDRSVIVEIPNIPVGTSTTIRIKTRAAGDKPSYEDLSTDEHGPKSGPNAGIFKISNNDHPGLCAVLGPDNTNVASSSAPITAFGRGLGNGNNSALLFGGINAPVRQWNEATILSSVPQNMNPGRVGVRAKIGNNFSNGVEFVVVDKNADLVPHIDSLSPSATSTLGSLLTIIGARFSSHGTVYLASTKEAALNCAVTTVPADEAACLRLDLATLPNACGNTWSDNQIIGKIPTGIPLGTYFLVVKNESAHHSDGAASIQFLAGDPLPGLCRIEPNTGVAPLPENADPLTITGVNLTAHPKLYFWSVNAFGLNSDNDFDPLGHSVIRSVSDDGTTIKTVLPAGQNGISMTTGPILARVGNDFSNSVQYNVQDCTLGGDAPGANYQCCKNGPEKGLWKPAAFACAGETRSAGYVWRFTTGLIPKVPRVVEACDTKDWDNLNINNFVRPSPSPWKNWNTGDACTDSVITVQFNMHMSALNLANAVRVYTCGQGDTPDCKYNAADDVTSNYTVGFLGGVQTDILEIRLAPGATHQVGTWHRVILGNGLHADEHFDQFNQHKSNTAPLSMQRTLPNPVNGITVAYNFDFKTGNAKCSLFGAAITPPTYTTHLLGMLQDPVFPISTNFDAPPHPFYYFVWGRGEQACSVVDVNGKGFVWKPSQGDSVDQQAYVTRSDNKNVPVTSTLYADSIRATVTALRPTALDPVVITASADTVVDDVHKQVTGSSNLFIQPGDPTAIDWWPQCNESCINANVGVKFNLPMRTDTYRINGQSALSIKKCAGPDDLDENCLNPAPAEGLPTRDINENALDPFLYEVTIPGTLEVNTLYQVTLSDQVLSFGGTLNGAPISGKPVIPKVWKFRTKIKDGICILDKVDVVPNPFVATLVGQKTAYGVSPLSSPNTCSAAGQRLNPWAYGWNWSIAADKPNVASLTSFSTKGNPAPFCGGSCLPLGSNIPFGQSIYLCGNGTVDPGEDCDVAVVGEHPGVSCSLSCLRPGNTASINTTTPFVADKCGNGAVETNVGEECDPAIPGQAQYCNNICNWKGSSQTFSDAVGALQCGNGKIGLGENNQATVGEDCDLGITLQAASANNTPSWAAVGCSQSCLHLGTRMSRAYCQQAQSNLTPDQKQSEACLNSATICGDGNVDAGEECEKDPTNNGHIKVILPNGSSDWINVASATTTCSNQCILQNICDVKANISSDFTCEKGSLGCNTDCTKAGSSAVYDPPSLCGDGAATSGENPRCEPAVDPNFVPLGQDPVQVVTAVGNGVVNPATLMQETKIIAAATQVRVSSTKIQSLADNHISGSGDYSLQCGYVEYPTPILENGVLHANNCPDATQGVGTNSCCQPRPTRTEEFPVNGSGVADNTKACRNTFISANFDREIEEKTTENNVLIASLHAPDYHCAAGNESDVTADVSALLAFSDNENIPHNVFAKIWNGVKQFFVDVFNSVVHAAVGGPNLNVVIQNQAAGKIWCTGKIVPTVKLTPKLVPSGDGFVTTTVMGISISDILDANTMYAVVLRGGNGGISDINGVGIQGRAVTADAQHFHKDDLFVFQTGADICRIKDISINPASQLFTAPNTAHTFTAEVHSTHGTPIVSTPGYAWSWTWEPHVNTIFTFPANLNSTDVSISSKNLEGTVAASAQATITTDSSNVETGRIFSGLSNLTALFCENPWPSLSTYPYEDGVTFGAANANANDDNFNLQTKRFDGRPIPPIASGNGSEYLNFSFGYCADAGKGGDKTDDLPLLQPVVQGNFPAGPKTCSFDGKFCKNDEDCKPVLRLVDAQGNPVINGFGVRRALVPQQCNPGAPAENSNLPDGTLKKFLFFSDKNDDAIGLQVFANPNRMTARQWFVAQQFPGIEKYQDIVVDGYDAITDGNNTYINALNELSDKRVHNYIYLLGVNADAQQNTRAVLQKILSTFTFNINIPERKSCLLAVQNEVDGGQYLPDNFATRAVSAVACTTDFDCRTNLGTPTTTTDGLCANGKTKFQRDWTRLNTVQTIQNKVEAVRSSEGSYPALTAGTYIPGYTNTHWPSWTRLLAAIGPIPENQINQWSACGHCDAPSMVNGQPQYTACAVDSDCGVAPAKCVLPDDMQTCWNSPEASFTCPTQSSVLEYASTSTQSYKLFLPLEYFNASNLNQLDIIKTMVSTTHYSAVSSCGENGLQVLQPAAGKCGNNVLNIGEQCDPPGASNPVQFVCPQGQSAFETCNATCHYDQPVCRANASCGNGHIDDNTNPAELCDDGNLNGTYGHCNATCTGQFAGSCGNGVRDYDDKNHNNHQDAGEGFVEYCDKGDAKFVGFGYCEKNPSKSCDGRFDDFGADSPCLLSEGSCLSKNDPTYDLHKTDGQAQPQERSCSVDCQSVGGYCGDGTLQISNEECDDGNTNNLDGCTQYCKTENLACVNAIPAAKIDATSPNTVITLTYDNSLTEQCVNTDGDHICAGMGLHCNDVLVSTFVGLQPPECGVDASGHADLNCMRQPAQPQFEFQTFGLFNACQHPLDKTIGADVQIVCKDHRAGQAAAAVVGSCGNSVIDTGEACDLGANNGKGCDAEYGRSCTYCAADCKKVLTQDPLNTCGNGKIDVDGRLPLVNGVPAPEVCDIDPQTNQVVIPDQDAINAGIAIWTQGHYAPTNRDYHNLYNLKTKAARCIDQGTFSCENNCQNLVTSCVGCETVDGAGKPIPKIAVLNVLTPKDPADEGQANNLNFDWGRNLMHALIRLNTTTASGVKNIGSSTGWASSGNNFIKEDESKAVGSPNRWRQYQQAYNTGDYNQLWWLLSSRDNFPLDRGYGWKTSANQNGPWSNQIIEYVRGLESNPICQDQYALYFNLDTVTEKLGGDRLNIGSTLNAAGAKDQYARYGSFFPYPVNGELHEINHEMTLSPAVPQGTFRVVVKWKHFIDQDVTFAPVVYNRAFVAANATNAQRLSASVDSLRAASAHRSHPAQNWLCSRMRSQYDGIDAATQAQLAGLNILDYWLPDACESFYGDRNNVGALNLPGYDGSIFVHAPGTLPLISEEASTIVTGNIFGTRANGYYNTPYAVFVESISADSSVPISSFADFDVTVEVYEYHEGQIPETSLYEPTQVYSLKTASQSSNDGIPKYWHVFNLIKSDSTHKYEIQPISEAGRQYPQGALDTGFVDVLCRIPGEPCNRDQ